MKTSERLTYMKNIILPCLLFSGFVGILTGSVIFLFKLASSRTIELSEKIYEFVRSEPKFLPLLIGGTALLGVTAGVILRFSPHSRGGGIPTAVAILRGLITFKWIKSVFWVFFSSMLTYLCGVPLGNEGPSVQIGTALGKGTVSMFAGKHRAWDRYVMTGGACAGFAVATGAPVSGIFFALEEAHRRFSPMIIMVAATSVISGMFTSDLLCKLTGTDISSFGIKLDIVLKTRYFWAVLIIGLACGLFAALFAKCYKLFRAFVKRSLTRLPVIAKITVVFSAVSLIGFASYNCIGAGHSLLRSIIDGTGVWYLLLIYLCVRAILIIVANNAGVTGGLFVPTLVFGAIIGSVCAKAIIATGAIGQEYYQVMVVIGMASFLGASVRTPITAIIFAVEALSGLSNVLYIALGVTFAYLVIEMLGISSINDIVIETKVEDENFGKERRIIDTHVTVQPGAFVIGKETRDIFWPPTCVILSVQKHNDPGTRREGGGIQEGDILHVHFQTYDFDATAETLCSLVGEQQVYENAAMRRGNPKHKIPETQ